MQNPFWSTPFIRILLLLLAGLALPFLWPGLLLNLFSTAGFEVEHHHDWPTSLVTLHVGSDLLIGLSYGVIASILAFIVFQNRRHLPFDWVVLAFGLFIIACGITHIMHVVTRFTPVYYLDTYLRALTAIVSVATAIALPPLIPRVKHLLQADQDLKHSRDQLQTANTLLNDQQQALENARNWAEFHASLSDLLQNVHDPDTLAEKALYKIGPALFAEQVTLIRIRQERATLWHFWGHLKPESRRFLEGEGTPLSELKLLGQVVNSRAAHYTDLYPQGGEIRVIADHPIAAFEPILNTQGEVVAVLAFSRPDHHPWTEQERQLASRAAFTLSLALERTELQQQLQHSQRELLEAQRNAPLAEMVVDMEGRVVRANPAASRILGYTEEELRKLDPRGVIHPDDLSGTDQNLQQLHTREVDLTDQQKRYRRKDGSLVWVQLHLSLIRDTTGHPVRYVMQFSDITERKKAEFQRDRAERYSQAQAKISKLLEENLAPLEMAREASRIVAETAGLDYTGLMTVEGDTGQVSTVFLADHASPEFRYAIEQPVPRGRGLSWKSLEEGKPYFVENHLQHKNANPIFLKAGVTAVAYFPVVPSSSLISAPMVFVACWLNGKTRWDEEDRNLLEAAARTLKVAVEREEHLRKLEQAALCDELTKLGNRRAFEADLKAEHARAKRHKHSLGLMVLDLDGLKEINDHMGHEGGDRLLQTFAVALKQHMRVEDRCYRLGGDEFAVILAHSPLSSSERLHVRLQAVIQDVQNQGFPSADVSAGIAYFPEERSSSEDLVRLADERMYLMKAQHHLERD